MSEALAMLTSMNCGNASISHAMHAGVVVGTMITINQLSLLLIKLFT